MKLRLMLGAAAMCVAAPLSAQSLTAEQTRAIDDSVSKALAATGTPSASIAVVRDGRIVLAKAYGKASETIPQARTDLPYQIASISKQFTAAAVLLLRRDGKLSLEDTVAKYVPGITGGDTITIRQLLSHTSGLQDYWPQDYSFAAMERPTTPQQIVDRWAKKPLDFAPGTQWQYSNTGYVVAGMIVEKVAGEPLLAFLQKRVFKPLGMKAMDQDLAVGPRYPQGYHRYALGPVRVEKPAASGWLYAAGELAMSPTDLAKWDIARLNRTLLTPAEWAEQESAIKLSDGKDTGYGLGVDVGQQDGRRIVEHGGEAVGFLSENVVYSDSKTAVVVLTNSDFGNAQTVIARDIAKLVLPPVAPGAATGDESARTAAARRVFDMLRGGTLDRALLTQDAAYYFTPEALADYRASLSALGEPTGFEAVRGPRLRGGFVNRNYRVTYGDRTLNIITYAEPGEAGRYEQFLVQPAS
ncbi:CubicO group peptidase, beta-lactamase class C family [Sphingomonas gellani]|uniref:CubicO group peptidase, beta-lactamase class C family n=1 Tax=Sphingomonas gellani TaxID=1166340 RepID=A0A1H8EMN8_9SPHN|nr:serine hydrolase domain-containing protein [Sphingomonas gellani]SEN20650.1 CubicO group peptidase, beta-lactamase class C family [Sphingomonas gellani]